MSHNFLEAPKRRLPKFQKEKENCMADFLTVKKFFELKNLELKSGSKEISMTTSPNIGSPVITV